MAGMGAEPLSIGVMIPSDRIARVIGKAGAGLKQLREMSACKVQVQQSSDTESLRRVDLSGGIDGLATAFQLTLRKAFPEDTSVSPTVLIPADKAGLVVGKGGDNLKRVREACGVRISLEREPVADAASGTQERVVAMQGDVAAMSQALRIALGGGTGPMPYMGAMPLGAAMSMMPGMSRFGCMGMPGLSHVRAASTNAEEVQVHMVVPDRLAGAILGKDGAQVKQTAATSACKVSMTTRDGMSDRRIVMQGTYSQCAEAQGLVCEQMQDAAVALGQENVDTTSIFFIRKEAAGAVVGKQGAALRQIRELSGAKIQLAREEVEGQRPCSITGPLELILQAEKLIFELVRAVPVDTTVRSNGAGMGYNSYGGGYPFGGGMSDMSMKRQDFSPFAPMMKRRGDDDGSVVTKLLIPARSAGAVIGKQGSGLKQLRETYGVNIEMLQQVQAPHWPNDRILILKGALGPRQSAVDAVLRFAFMDGEGATLKMLVPSSAAGSVIGRQGGTLRSVREQAGVGVQVERDEVLGERLITATGTLAGVTTAATIVLAILEGGTNAAAGAANSPSPQQSLAQQHVGGLSGIQHQHQQQGPPTAYPQYQASAPGSAAYSLQAAPMPAYAYAPPVAEVPAQPWY